jgi:uncharacterized repeat protein (TIGR03803 family)
MGNGIRVGLLSKPFRIVAIILLVLAGRGFNARAQTNVYTVLHSFGSSANDGTVPLAGLIQGSDGNLYGTTSLGGTNNQGTVFRISPSGNFTNLYSFAAGSGTADNVGANPAAGLVQGIDSNFYGTTEYGGTSNAGTVFRISPSGNFTNLYSFAAGSGTADNIEANPAAGLVQGIDSNFYGTTEYGGTTNAGTVFRISPSGNFTNLYSFFPTGNEGAYPAAGLVQGLDGNFYGTTEYGGTNNQGTVFRISPSGNFTNLYSFTGYVNNEGVSPAAGLVQGSDSNFYGTTEYGGISSGTVFRISPSGNFTNLYSFFPTGNEGAYPAAGLVEGSDGNFYGTTEYGGTNNAGTIFRISPSGNFTNLYSFFPTGNEGAYPAAGLVQGLDGNFYGTTEYGGTSYSGTVFKLSIPLNPPPNQVSAIQLSGTNVVITIPTIAGVTYQLQFSSSLVPTGNWVNVGTSFFSPGGSQSLTGSGGSPRSNGFYRAEGVNDPGSGPHHRE